MSDRSQWLTDVNGECPQFGSLDHDVSTDIAIIGGGFVGLWTAIALKTLEPTRRVTLLEAEECGGGASGLNGGFVMSWWPKIASLMRVCGTDDAVWLADETTLAAGELGDYLAAHGVDAEYRGAGWLWTATAPAHVGSWLPVVEAAERLGRGNIFRTVTREELAKRTGSSSHIAGVCETINGTVHPGRLGVALTRIAKKLGVEIYEHTRVMALERTRPAVLRTKRGSVTADRVVIATNAWAASVPELRREFGLRWQCDCGDAAHS